VIHSTQSITVRCLAVLLLVLVSVPLRAGVSSALLEINERFYQPGGGREIFPGSTVHAPDLVSAFYQSNGYQPAWTDPDYVREMLDLLASARDEGLNPADYHHGELLELIEEYRKPWSDRDLLRARAEVLLTDGILLYARHLIQGKVDPRTLDESWNYTRRKFDPGETARDLSTAIAARQVAPRLEALKFDSPFYARMKSELRRYRELAATEQFSPVPDDKVLRLGDEHPNVIPLRRRLQAMGYLRGDAPSNASFDDAVKLAVMGLQRDHGLDVDGIAGAQSYFALNLSYQERVDKLRINLDRLRWISQDVSDDFVVVNIAGYELYYLRDREMVWQTPVMVGAINTRTPIFQRRLRYLEFNPTWNAPRSLVVRSLFGRFSADPQYVIDKKYRLYDGNGKAVDPLSLDWSAYNATSFPYRVVQMPGPDNAMGRVKFMFPNRHAVYLHDTPSRQLFSRSARAFSAGCIRVKNPLELARVLLDDPQQWSAESIQALVDSGDPQVVVQVERPVDVMLMYWTVSPESGEHIEFHPDVYQLDRAALAALDAPPSPARSGGNPG
jgi:murein L,D-transpeptidase YcbB/YkuD